MAERRMFAKTIIDSDAFLDMPQSTQLLYFQLAMRADDDGFINNPKSIMRNVGCKEDDLKLLAAKKFILPFESGVVVIKHWKIHNYIQKDRYTETKYKDEKSMLSLDENNSYTLEVGDYTSRQETRPLSSARIRRIEAKKNSSLPYSFEYKIRGAFVGEICPICGVTMDYSNNLTKPTIQHNTPISMGGVHEIENISVICQSCNTSIQNKTITEKLNTEKVRKVWECIGNVSGMDTQVRLELGKDRLGKDREEPPIESAHTRFKKPTLQEVLDYCKERRNTVNAQRFIDYYESKGWKVGREGMKDWKAAVRTWEASEKAKPSPPSYSVTLPDWQKKLSGATDDRN